MNIVKEINTTVSLVLLGQIFLFTTPIEEDIIPKPIWLCLAGVILFVFNLIFKPTKAMQSAFSRLPISGPFPWVLTAIVASILTIVASYAFGRTVGINYFPVISFWFISATSYIAAFTNLNGFTEKYKNFFKTHKQELIQLALIILFGIFLRVYKLGSIPRVINGDEGWLGVTAVASNTATLANPFALWENFGALYLHAVNFCIMVLGPTSLALRIMPTIAGILGIPAIYLLGRQIAGHRVGLIAAAMVSFSHTHLHFSRSVTVGYIQGDWLVPLELYFFLSSIKKRSSWRAAVAGALLAFHFNIYLSAQIIVGLIIIFLIISFFLFKSWLKPAFQQIKVFFGGLIIIVLPVLEFAILHPDEFFNRLNTEGTFQTGWLNETMISTGQSAFVILSKRVIHAFLSLNYYPASDFYGSPIPIMTLISSTLFFIGLGLILWRVFSPNFMMLNGYFWGFTVAVGVFAIPPSADAYRMLSALPPALIISAYAFDQILDMLGVGWHQSHRKYLTITTIMLVSLAVFNLWTYFYDFAGQCKYGADTQTRFASYLGKYASQVSKNSDIYLLADDIYFYGSHLTVDYLSEKRPITNVKESIDSVSMYTGDTIIANPNRVQELKDWARLHPGGKMDSRYDCDKIILFSYQLP
jgi:hypothetical protein